ncbi:hypothetical protein [Flavobacterium sp. HNIBRBA15423]|uniref:hypothetical protein n=1 Tax=Flavobacterium sp. HNIBRBA15423 TaxID=3458683 RepID=UPI004044045C
MERNCFIKIKNVFDLEGNFEGLIVDLGCGNGLRIYFMEFRVGSFLRQDDKFGEIDCRFGLWK